jgi:hypothetical protein
MIGNVDNNENTNWLQQLRLGNKTFDHSWFVTFKGKKSCVYTEKDKLVGILGDKDLAETIKPYFEEPIKVMTGGTYNDDNGNTVSWDGIKELKPGDKDYIESVLIDYIRNKLGMDIE